MKTKFKVVVCGKNKLKDDPFVKIYHFNKIFDTFEEAYTEKKKYVNSSVIKVYEK